MPGKIYQVVMGRMDGEQSGLKPAAMIQSRITNLLARELQPDWKASSNAEEFQRKNGDGGG